MTTDKQFALFQREVRKRLAEFGLVGWHVSIARAPTATAPNRRSAAWVSYDANNRCAEITLNSQLRVSADDIKRYALHEVLHLLLARLCTTAESRWATIEELETEEHAIIRTLENILLPGP